MKISLHVLSLKIKLCKSSKILSYEGHITSLELKGDALPRGSTIIPDVICQIKSS